MKCNAQDQEGQCKSCRHCWDKKIKVVVYPSHGQRIRTVLKERGLTQWNNQENPSQTKC